MKSLNDANITWPTKDDDFFPYASDPHTYWTGYFTSRPTLKYFERLGNNFLQVCKQLYSLANLGPEDMVDLDAMREAMGIMQHHDAITGTEKQLVAFDYARILSNGFKECAAVASAAINKLMTPPSVQSNEESQENVVAANLDITSCLLTNISQCDISEGAEPFIVTVYNPLSRVVHKYVRLPVSGAAYSVKDSAGTQLQVQIVPIQKELMEIPGRESQATYELIFKAQDLPPLGFRSYYVSRANYILPAVKKVTFGLGTESGLMEWAQSNEIKIQVKQELFYYEGMQGNNEEFKNRSSGAYIFRPNGTEAKPLSTGPVATTIIRGDIVDEVHQKFSDWGSQVIRVYKEENHIEFNWLVGPIPVEDGIGKEVISRFTTEINNAGMFYTDSNGREMLLRRRRSAGEESNSANPEVQGTIVEPIGGNYYPVTSRIRIAGLGTNTALALSVLTDRAQGGSSIHDGEVE
ncbi:hypothetical protein J437_LFUL007812 [Ladona fulva]|uniref:Glycoside hydrolase family 38 central domain-containing protein n=1 Tax=Ladona fulva TaxID=123851 RepID=A0A8K0JSP5_LADFU|nr:hypothetical protein J437_LFUL007812 [Ladona fulva]